MKHTAQHRPSASLVVAIVALVLAASGSAFAAGRLVSGDGLIRQDSLSGNRLRYHTLGAAQVNVAKLGVVPSAQHAVVANTATNAQELGGKPPSAYLGTGPSDAVSSNGIVKVTGSATGTTATVLSSGPFSLSVICTSSSSGPSLTLDASSTEDQSDLAGTFAAANTPTDTGDDVFASTTPASLDNLVLTLQAPSGARLVLDGAVGVSSLGADCWASFTGTS